MTLDIPKNEWKRFFDDLSRRRFEWLTKVEVFDETIGSQILTDGLPLVGVTAEEKNGATVIDISIGEETGYHQTHNIANPTKVAYLNDDNNIGGIVEIEEEKGTKTLIHIIEPMPVIIGYSEYRIISQTA
jgi:hypothetical protein